MTTYELWRENTDKTKPPTPLIKSNKKADIDSAISLLKKDSLGHGLYIREWHHHTDGTFHKAEQSQLASTAMKPEIMGHLLPTEAIQCLIYST